MQLRLVYGQRPEKVASRNLSLYDLIRYANSNFIGDLKDRKSLMRYYFFLNRVIIS